MDSIISFHISSVTLFCNSRVKSYFQLSNLKIIEPQDRSILDTMLDSWKVETLGPK